MIGLNSLLLALIVGPFAFVAFAWGRYVGAKDGYRKGSHDRAMWMAGK